MSDRISDFVDELLSPGGASIRLYYSLKEDPPPAGDLAPVLLRTLSRASTRGVIDGTSLALALAAEPRYRPVVETALAEERLPPENRHLVFEEAVLLDGDAVLWWFDMLDERHDGDDQAMHSLVLTVLRRTETLMEHRRDRVVALLSETTRGPANFTVEAVGSVLRVSGLCAPLERRWSDWIRDGLFDSQELTGPNGSTVASMNVRWLERCVEEGPFPRDWVLLDETVAHWRELLTEPGRRRAGVYGLAQVMLDRRTLCGRLPGGVLPCLETGTPDDTALEEGFRALARGDRKRAGDIALGLLDGFPDR